MNLYARILNESAGFTPMHHRGMGRENGRRRRFGLHASHLTGPMAIVLEMCGLNGVDDSVEPRARQFGLHGTLGRLHLSRTDL